MSTLIVTSALFSLGLYGVLTRRDIIAILASVEVMVGAALVLLMGFAAALTSEQAASLQAVALLVLILAASEAAVGLALVVAVARKMGTTRIDDLTEVNG